MVKFISSPTHETLPETADVVIIGGGPAGTSALWALHRADPTLNLVLIESASQLASGSTTASLENFRTAWQTACIAEMMKYSAEVFAHADDYMGEGAKDALHLKTRGYLFLGFTDNDAQALRDDVTLLNSLGLPHIEYLDAAAVQQRFGWVGKRVIAAKYDPTAGWMDSYAMVTRFAQSAANATILLDCADNRLVVEHGQITGVRLAARTIQTRHVVLANGAWARKTGEDAGIIVPVVARPRQSFTTEFRHEAFPADAPMLIGAHPFMHVRPEAGSSAIFGYEYTWNTKNADPSVGFNADHDALLHPQQPISALKDPRFPSVTLTLFARQFKHQPGEGFADPRYMRGIRHNIGYYVYRDDTTAYQTLPDGTHQHYHSERAILDEHPDARGLFLSVAHSGHGIMTAPAVGQIIASKVLGQPLAHPLYAQFALDVPFVEHDANAL